MLAKAQRCPKTKRGCCVTWLTFNCGPACGIAGVRRLRKPPRWPGAVRQGLAGVCRVVDRRACVARPFKQLLAETGAELFLRLPATHV